MPQYKNTRDKISHIIRHWYQKYTTNLTSVRLTHINGQRRDNLVDHFVFAKKQGKNRTLRDADLEVFAQEIEHAAMDHGEAFTGLQSYKISALVQGSENPVSSRTFKVSIYDEEGEDSPTEPPTERGITSQLMRLLDASHRSSIVGQMQLQRAFGDMLEKVTQRNDHLEQRQFETYEILEKLLSLQQDRDLALKESTARIEHRSEAIKIIKQLGPVIANRIAGGNDKAKKLLGAGDSLAMLVRSFLQELTDEQAEAIVDELVADQQEMFIELVKKVETQEHANVTAGFRTWAMSLQPKQRDAINNLLTPTQRIQVSEIWQTMIGAPSSSSAKN